MAALGTTIISRKYILAMARVQSADQFIGQIVSR